MKIVAVQSFPVPTSWRTLVLVKVTTDEGLTGFGECTISNREEGVLGYLQGAVRRHVLGSDPFNIEDLWLRMYRNEFWRGGSIACTVLSGIELACWDIVGKALGQPVWKLLGGKCREKVKVYANGWYTGERTPEEFARRAKAVAEKGYRALKLDPSGPGELELDRSEIVRSGEILAAVREAVGPDFEIFIDCHGRFNASTAIALAQEFEPSRPGWMEEPCPPEDIVSLKKIADKVRIPIAAGERCYTRYGCRELIESGAVDILQTDLTHVGGFLEMKKVAALADVRSILMAPHNSSSPLATAIAVHFDLCTTNFKIQEYFGDFAEPWWQEIVRGGPKPVEGFFLPPEKPGWGVELDEAAIRAHPYKPVEWNLWQPGWEKQMGYSR